MKNNESNVTRWDKFANSMDNFGNMVDSMVRPFFDGGDLMKTDIKENYSDYLMDVELPGYEKKDISVSLEEGYVTVKAEKCAECEEGGKHNYIRRERSSSCSRSYYVGEDVKEDEIKAKYENGVLIITVPKAEPKKPNTHTISID